MERDPPGAFFYLGSGPSIGRRHAAASWRPIWLVCQSVSYARLTGNWICVSRIETISIFRSRAAEAGSLRGLEP